jgi:hypothetical protein
MSASNNIQHVFVLFILKKIKDRQQTIHSLEKGKKKKPRGLRSTHEVHAPSLFLFNFFVFNCFYF